MAQRRVLLEQWSRHVLGTGLHQRLVSPDQQFEHMLGTRSYDTMLRDSGPRLSDHA